MSTVNERNIVQQNNDIKNILDTEHGRRFIWRLISYCGIYRDVDPSTDDVMKQLGRRQAGLYLLGIISDVDDEQVFKMMREAKNKEQEDNYARSREQNDNDSNADADGGASHSYTGDALNDYI